MRSPNSLGSWKNDLSGLWNVSDMMPSWNGKFSLKSKLILGLISCEFWLCVIFYLICCFGGLRSRSGWKGTSGIKGLLFNILSFAIVCSMHTVCFPCFYFGSSRNFLWQVWWVVNSLIDGIWFLPLWSGSPLSYLQPLQIFLFGKGMLFFWS